MKIPIPNSDDINLSTLILDLNGTLTVKGVLIDGVLERVNHLKQKGLNIVIFSGDTRGTSQKIAKELGVESIVASTGEEKKAAALKLDPETCVAIGNGKIDVPLFKTVKLSIATLQAEGIYTECLQVANIVVPSILDALDILLDERSLGATLRP